MRQNIITNETETPACACCLIFGLSKYLVWTENKIIAGFVEYQHGVNVQHGA
jgi:hypothetical protein